MKINEYSTERAKHQIRYKRNRDHASGIDAVKNAGIKYLPKASANQTNDEYVRYKNRTHYFPAASRTADGLAGLVFRKAPVLTAPDNFKTLVEYVTQDALTLDDLAEKVFYETLVTNFTGLLADHPEMPAGLSLAQAIEQGFRPFTSIYIAESILEASYSIIKNRKRLSKVRLLDDEKTVREMFLDDAGIYTVNIWKTSDQHNWNIESTSQPLRNSKVMTEIPFTIVTNGKDKAPLDDICAMNNVHYIHSADESLALYFVSAPIPVITGVKDDVELSVEVGTAWRFEDKDAKAEYLEFTGAGIKAIREKLSTITENMAAIGSRMLASDKAAAEAAETLAIRKASENSVLASLSRTVSRKIEDSLKWLAYWMEIDETDISYSLNSDFLPTQMTAQEMTALMNALQAGHISHETFYDALQKGEVVSEAVSFEEEQSRIDNSPLGV